MKKMKKTMKRTRTARLLLMGLSPLVLAACNSGTQHNANLGVAGEERLFRNAEDCTASGEHNARDCQAAFETASAEHAASAPRYATQQECAAQHGEAACTEEKTASGHSSFMPFMMGMLMGRAFNTGFSRPAYSGDAGQPVKGGNGQYWSGGSNPAQRPGTPPGQGLPPPPAQGKVVTQARAGFGQSMASGARS